MAARPGEGRAVVGNRRLRRVSRCVADEEHSLPCGVASAEGELEVAALLDLLDVAFTAGMSVPGALDAVGQAVRGGRGGALSAAANALTLGAGWSEAWRSPLATGGTGSWTVEATRRVPAGLGPVADALRATWEDGAPPRATVRAAASALRRERHARAMEAAARLGVRLVLPLGLCYLPAFVLVGLVPVVVSMAARTLAP